MFKNHDPNSTRGFRDMTCVRALRGLSFLILILLFSYSVLAQATPEQASPTPAEASENAAPVVLDDRTVFLIRAPNKALSIEERASTVSSRIKRLADDTTLDTEDVRVVDSTDSSDIFVRDQILSSVLDADADAEGRTRTEVAQDRVIKIKAAVAQYRQKYSLQSALIGGALSLLTIGALFLLLILIKRNFPRLRQTLLDQMGDRITARNWKLASLLDIEQLKKVVAFILNLLRLALTITLIIVALQLVLGFLPWTENLASGLFGLLIGPIQTLGLALVREIPNLIFIGVVAIITFYLLKLLKSFFRAIRRKTITFRGFAPEWAMFTYRLIKIAVIVFALIISFPYIPGSDSEAFRAITIFLGVLISFGSSSIVANTIAGITLNYLRSFNVGDRVKIGEYTGDILRSSLQVTHLRTIKNEEIIVPNSLIVSSQVVNFTTYAKDRGLILHTKVTIGYDAPWRQVHALLLMAAEKTDGILSDPKPFILQTSLDDFYVAYELNGYTNIPQEMARIYSELHKNIQDAFNEYGVQIMSPNYIADRDEPTVVPKEKWFESPASPSGTSGESGNSGESGESAEREQTTDKRG